MDAKLVIISPDVQPKEFKLTLPTTIGRSRQATIKLAHALVSRIHCELYEQDGVLMVRDLGSLNGTLVEGNQVTEGPIGAGETLTVGTVSFMAMYTPPPGTKTKTLSATITARAAVAARKPAGHKSSSGELMMPDDQPTEQIPSAQAPSKAPAPPAKPAPAAGEDDDVLEWLMDEE
jgi:pSer/pThr/pTyr-binding forkhead associated (FHA) protein